MDGLSSMQHILKTFFSPQHILLVGESGAVGRAAGQLSMNPKVGGLLACPWTRH